jgi:hypothetical protein
MNFVDLKEYKDHAAIMAQSLALIGLVVVGFGFLTLTIYHASFGIPQISFIRPKIFSAGVLLIAMAAAGFLPAIFFVALRPAKSGNLKADLVTFVLTVEAFLAGVTVAACIYLRPLLTGPGEQPFIKLRWLLLILIPPAFISAISVKNWPPWACITRSAVIITLIAIGLIGGRDELLALLVAWLILCGFSAHMVRSYFLRPKDFNYPIALFMILGAVSLFARNIYPHAPAYLCGGAPMPATVTFADKTMLGTNGQSKVWMLDETDAGFYFLQAKDAKTAVYVPRAGVSLIVYGDESHEGPKR